MKRKVNKSVTLDPEVVEFIDTVGLNFSQEVNLTILSQMMDTSLIDRYVEEAKLHYENIQRFSSKIHRQVERCRGILTGSCPDALEFLRGVPGLLKDPEMKLENITNRFNVEFKMDIGIPEMVYLIKNASMPS